jgi:hypothetical protein
VAGIGVKRTLATPTFGGSERLLSANSGRAQRTKKTGQDNLCPASRLNNDYFFAPQLDAPAIDMIASFSASVISPAFTKSSLAWATLRT